MCFVYWIFRRCLVRLHANKNKMGPSTFKPSIFLTSVRQIRRIKLFALGLTSESTYPAEETFQASSPNSEIEAASRFPFWRENCAVGISRRKAQRKRKKADIILTRLSARLKFTDPISSHSTGLRFSPFFYFPVRK